MPEKSVSTDSLGTAEKQAYSGKRLRVAIIGCGGISDLHLRTLQNFPDVQLVAAVDIKPARLQIVEEKFGIKKLFTDWKKMLAEIQPDAVSICTPNGVHAAPTIDALNAKCHVIVEKPMAMNPGECRRMID